jgi:hypothetical protein
MRYADHVAFGKIGEARQGNPGHCSLIRGAKHAASDLILFDRLEQCFEIAFTKPVITLALNELKKDRAYGSLTETLQQYLGEASLHHAFAINENAVLLQSSDVLAMTRQAAIDAVVIEVVRCRHESYLVRQKRFDGVVQVMRAQRYVLNAFAPVLLEIFFDLAALARVFVDRDAVRAAQLPRKRGSPQMIGLSNQQRRPMRPKHSLFYFGNCNRIHRNV